MEDLKEHFGMIMWLLGGLAVITGGLIAIVWNFFLKSLNSTKEESEKFSKWMIDMAAKGGVVSRDDHFEFCAKEKAKCPIWALDCWKDEILENGGPLTMALHKELCREVTKQVEQTLGAEVKHHREIMLTEFKLIRATIKNDVVFQITSMRDEIMKMLKDHWK